MIQEEIDKGGPVRDAGKEPLVPKDFELTFQDKLRLRQLAQEKQEKESRQQAAVDEIEIVIGEPIRAELPTPEAAPKPADAPAKAELAMRPETAVAEKQAPKEKRDIVAEERAALAKEYASVRESVRGGKESLRDGAFRLLADIVRQVGRENTDLNALILKEGLANFDQKKHGKNKFVYDVGLESVARQNTAFVNRLEMFMQGPKDSAGAIELVSADVSKWLKSQLESEKRRTRLGSESLLKAQQRIWDARGWRAKQKHLPEFVAKKSDSELADYIDDLSKRKPVWNEIKEQLLGGEAGKDAAPDEKIAN